MLIAILKITGIVFACIGGFIVFAIVTPFTYRADVSYHGSLDADIKAGWLLGLLRIFVSYTDDKPKVLVKLLMFTVFDSTKKKKKKKKKRKGRKKNKGDLRLKNAVSEKDDEALFELEDEKVQEDSEDLKDKFIRIMDKIINILKAAVEKTEAALVWLDSDHRRLYGFLWTNGLKLFKKVKPKRFAAFISGGTGDPSSTGMIVSFVSIGLGLAGIDTVRLEPDFKNRGIDADVSASGYFFVFPVIMIALRIYFNKDFKRFILKKPVKQ